MSYAARYSALSSRTSSCYPAHGKDVKNSGGKLLSIRDEQNTPNKEWLLVFVSTYRSDLKIFRKDYVSPPRILKKQAKPSISLPITFQEWRN